MMMQATAPEHQKEMRQGQAKLQKRVPDVAGIQARVRAEVEKSGASSFESIAE